VTRILTKNVCSSSPLWSENALLNLILAREIMALLRIRKYPDPALKQSAKPIANIDADVNAFLDSMVQTMYAAPGVGLAATQVGDSRRLVVIDTDHQNPGKHLLKLINPRIVEAEGSIVWEEGCLSVIDFSAEVKRASKVLVRAWTPEQKEVEIEAADLQAVAFQHELDHLDGKLFIDRLSRIKRELYRRRLLKMLKEGKADGQPPSHVRI
jgi:peptide deformylase